VRGLPHPLSRKLVCRRVHYEQYCRIETVLHIAETFQLPSLRLRKREILQHTTLAERWRSLSCPPVSSQAFLMGVYQKWAKGQRGWFQTAGHSSCSTDVEARMSLNQLSADICPATEGKRVQIYRQSSWLNHQFHGLCVLFFLVGFVPRLRRHCLLKLSCYFKARI